MDEEEKKDGSPTDLRPNSTERPRASLPPVPTVDASSDASANVVDPGGERVVGTRDDASRVASRRAGGYGSHEYASDGSAPEPIRARIGGGAHPGRSRRIILSAASAGGGDAEDDVVGERSSRRRSGSSHVAACGSGTAARQLTHRPPTPGSRLDHRAATPGFRNTRGRNAERGTTGAGAGERAETGGALAEEGAAEDVLEDASEDALDDILEDASLSASSISASSALLRSSLSLASAHLAASSSLALSFALCVSRRLRPVGVPALIIVRYCS